MIPSFTVEENMNLSSIDHYSKKGLFSTTAAVSAAKDMIHALKIRCTGTSQPAYELSGGNQQKAIVARWMSTKPEVLILDAPTKGIDVGAKSEFYNMICEFAKEGLAVILISSELPEVIGLSDRIIVMRGRRSVGEISAKDATEEKLLSMAMMEET